MPLEAIEHLQSAPERMSEIFDKISKTVKNKRLAVSLSHAVFRTDRLEAALECFKQIKKKHNSLISDEEVPAALAFTSLVYQVSPEVQNGIYESVRSSLNDKMGRLERWTELDDCMVSDLTSLVITHGGDTGLVIDTFLKIYRAKELKLSSAEAVSTLASAALVTGFDKVHDDYLECVSGQKFSNSESPAILVLAANISGVPIEDILRDYRDVQNDTLARKLKVHKMSEEEKAVLICSMIIGKYEREEILKLFDKFKNQKKLDRNVALRLILSLAADRQNSSILCREEYGYLPAGKVLIPYSHVTIMDLGRPATDPQEN